MRNWIQTLTVTAALLMAGQLYAFHVKPPQHRELPARHLSRTEIAAPRASASKKRGSKAAVKEVTRSAAKSPKGRKARAEAVAPAPERRGHLRRISAVIITRGRNVGRRVFIPASPLRGSHDLQVLQNMEIDSFNLERIQTDDELLALESNHTLVRIPETDALHISPNIEESRRYARPWTAEFARDMATSFFAKFHHPIELTSAVRTAEQQKRLQRHNGNAAPIEGDAASSHLAGTTFDIGKSNLTGLERKWLTDYLLPLSNAHVIVAIEEYRQSCFHIMVSPSYDEWKQP